MKYYAGILAGGIGSRMENASIPKQFLAINGIPVMVYTIRNFLAVTEIEHIYIAMNPDWIEYAEKLLEDNSLPKEKITIIQGGRTRFESLLFLAKEVSKNGRDSVLISHDCARPFVSSRIIKDNMLALEKYDMVTTSIPVIDTILLSEDGETSAGVPKRSELYSDQGPQSFVADKFLELFHGLSEDEVSEYMEAGKLYLKYGLSVGIAMGSRENFKITNDIDLKIAKAMLEEKDT